MPDREKVIKGLECCLHGPMQCKKCPYMSEIGETVPNCVKTMRTDAISLLKEQEPVTPIEREGFYYCGECKYAFTVHRQKYCSNCGKAVKWE